MSTLIVCTSLYKVTQIDPGMSAEQMREITLELLNTNLACYAVVEACWIVHNISRGLSIAGAGPTVQGGQADGHDFYSADGFTQMGEILFDWLPYSHGDEPDDSHAIARCAY